MSEVVTVSGATATIYGTVANATAYLQLMIGDAYTAWRALTPDDQKRTLATATRYLDRKSWIASVNTFGLRDAFTDANGTPLFQYASYELAALAADDPSKLSTTDTGTNIKSAGAGSAKVEFFRPTSTQAGTSAPLPDVVQQLVGAYLASATSGGTDVLGGVGQSGDCESSFEDSGEFTRVGPF